MAAALPNDDQFMSSPRTMVMQLDSMQRQFESRFVGLERWLEKLSLAVDRISDQRSTFAVVETVQKAHESRIADIDKAINKLKDQQDQDRLTYTKQMTRLVTVGGILTSCLVVVGTAVVQVGLKIYFGG